MPLSLGFATRTATALALLVACGAASPAPGPQDLFPRARADAYLLLADGAVVAERNADRAHAPASLAKLMTALVVLERGWDPAAVVVVGPRAAAQRGAALGLRAGERLRASDLLTAMLVRSANDAAVALAESAAGDATRFVAAMNARAAALGLSRTHFANPTGLDAPGQTTSARDLARLAAEALERPEIAEAVARREGSIKTLDRRVLRFRNTNALLGSFAGARGVKTGDTARAGACLVAFVERPPRRALLVLLGAPDRWWTAAAMLEEALDARRR
ncbi:MAG: serine hydrolase [Candidatus Polarisedimenticolia bacterium]|nr:serine hydrolase [bacterium]